MYDKKLPYRYAMKARELGEKDQDFAGSVKVDAISASLSLPLNTGRGVASYLHRIGWAVTSFANEPPTLTLTPKGYEEIEKLLWPTWLRWLDKNLSIAISVLAVLISAASFFVSLLR
jgi:hypothetical protein